MKSLRNAILLVLACLLSALFAYATAGFFQPKFQAVAFFGLMTWAWLWFAMAIVIGMYEQRIAAHRAVWLKIADRGGRLMVVSLGALMSVAIAVSVLGMGMISKSEQGQDVTWFFYVAECGIGVCCAGAAIGAACLFVGNHFVKVDQREIACAKS